MSSKNKASKKRVTKKVSKRSLVSKRSNKRGESNGLDGSNVPGGTNGPDGPNNGDNASGDIVPRGPTLHELIVRDIIAGSHTEGQCSTVTYIADMRRVSTSTVYNHLRQFHRDLEPIFKTPRGLVYGSDASLEDMAKTQLKMTSKISGVAIEANAVCPVIIDTWGSSTRPDRNTIIGISQDLHAHSTTEWTRNVHSM